MAQRNRYEYEFCSDYSTLVWLSQI